MIQMMTRSIDEVRLSHLVKYATLAPSSHNTQPWLFQISDHCIQLRADPARRLPENDPDDRELLISCGCALMNLRVVAAHAHLSFDVELLPDDNDRALLAAVRIHTPTRQEGPESCLFPALTARRTYRKPFRPKAVPGRLLRDLQDEASEEGAWLEALETHRIREIVSALVAEGDSIQWSDPDWRRELASWLHARRAGDGLTVPAVFAPVARAAVSKLDMGQHVGSHDEKLVREAPLLAVLGTANDEPADWIRAGQAMEKVLLRACLDEVQASYLNQPIQIASLRPRLGYVLSMSGFPQLLLRLGYQRTELSQTPRRKLDHVMQVQ